MFRNSSPDSHPFLIGLLLVGILVITVAARISDITAKSGIYHDESISYLAVGCRMTDFPYVPETTEPKTAIAWKSFYQIDRSFCFGEISDGLALMDTHPPLFFWLLHLWSLLVGTHLWTGPVLNLFIAVATTLVLFIAAKELLGNEWEALTVTAIYAFMAPAVHITAEARQYQLLALVALLLILQSIKLTREHASLGVVDSLLLITTVAAGALTHYYFSFAVLGVVLFLIYKLARREIKRLSLILASLFSGYLLANALYPMIDIVLSRANRNRAGFDNTKLNIRIARLELAAGEFDEYWYGLVVLLIALLAGSIYLYSNGGKTKISEHLRKTNLHGIEILFFLFWFIAIYLVCYLTFYIPKHAMGPKYFSMALPLLGFVPVFLMRLLRFPWALTLAFPLVMLLFLTLDVKDNLEQPEIGLVQDWDRSDIVIVDNRARGILPQMLWPLHDDQQVIVGSQQFLIDNFDDLKLEITEKTIYISDISYGNSTEMRLQLLGLLEQAGYTGDESGSIPIRSGIARRNAPVVTLRLQAPVR